MLITIIALALVLSAVVLAHGNEIVADEELSWIEFMDAMHEVVTKDFDPENKELADEIHRGCMGG